MSWVHKLRLHDRRGKRMAESFSRYKIKVGTPEGRLKNKSIKIIFLLYGHRIHVERVRINRVRLPINPARGKVKRETHFSLSAFAPENLVSRDGFGSPVSRQPVHLHTQAESGAYLLRDSSRVPRRRLFIYLDRQTPSGQSRVHRVTQCVTMAFTPGSPPAQGQ